VVVHALGEGRQVVLLRKGGLADKGGLFELRGKEFFLYPTYEHQTASAIQPRHLKDYASILEDTKEKDQVPIQYYARVEEYAELSDLERLLMLRDEHIWSDQFVTQRFQYKAERPMQVLTVRVYRLPKPIVLDVVSFYRGCKSWVDLKAELSAEGAEPVLAEEAFRARAEEIRNLLGSDH